LATILIVGSGVVGEANGKGLIKKGHKVVFIDTNHKIVEKLQRQGFTAYLPSEMDDISDRNFELAMFCVPTPFGEDRNYGSSNNGGPNMSYIKSAIISHGKRVGGRKKKRKGKDFVGDKFGYHVVVIRSTIQPGTTRNVLLPLLELHSGMKVGRDIGLCFQPEFLRTATSENDFLNPRATIIGEFDKASGDVLKRLYSNFGKTNRIFRTDIETAEFAKYVHNSFNATKISFANEMALIGHRLGVDSNAVLRMVAVTAEGFWNPYYGIKGGKPYNGKCLPKDIKTFLAFAKKKLKFEMPLLSAVDSINSNIRDKQREEMGFLTARLRSRRKKKIFNDV
jgi:UDPglucose 6-dehydrogenase